MKTLYVRYSTLGVIFLAMLYTSCGPSVSTQTVEIELKLKGDMLFEGANSLQFSDGRQLADIAGLVGSDSRAIKEVIVSNAIIELDGSSRKIVESLLLQVVSDNQELVTIGTLNPLPAGNQFALSLAEDTAILRYLSDSGTTWVLDINITEDYMDTMETNGILTMRVDYTPLTN